MKNTENTVWLLITMRFASGSIDILWDVFLDIPTIVAFLYFY